MFGKRNVKEIVPELPEHPDLEIPVQQPQTVGMQGFTQEKPAPAPVPQEPAEQYQILEVAMPPEKGLYIYKIITNKYLGELGGIYEA